MNEIQILKEIIKAQDSLISVFQIYRHFIDKEAQLGMRDEVKGWFEKIDTLKGKLKPKAIQLTVENRDEVHEMLFERFRDICGERNQDLLVSDHGYNISVMVNKMNHVYIRLGDWVVFSPSTSVTVYSEAEYKLL